MDCSGYPVLILEGDGVSYSSAVELSESVGLEGNSDFNKIKDDNGSAHESELCLLAIFQHQLFWKKISLLEHMLSARVLSQTKLFKEVCP